MTRAHEHTVYAASGMWQAGTCPLALSTPCSMQLQLDESTLKPHVMRTLAGDKVDLMRGSLQPSYAADEDYNKVVFAKL